MILSSTTPERRMRYMLNRQLCMRLITYAGTLNSGCMYCYNQIIPEERISMFACYECFRMIEQGWLSDQFPEIDVNLN